MSKKKTPRITRHDIRHQALNILFAADVRRETAASLLEKTDSTNPITGPVVTEAKILVAFVEDNRRTIDRMISRNSDGWSLKRMGHVDRNIMRLAVGEILYAQTPAPIAINEAVNLASELGGDSSPRFVNGVLGAIQSEIESVDNIEALTDPINIHAPNGYGRDEEGTDGSEGKDSYPSAMNQTSPPLVDDGFVRDYEEDFKDGSQVDGVIDLEPTDDEDNS